VTQWELTGYKRKPRRPRKNWVDVIKRDPRHGLDLGRNWDTGERQSRMASMAQCTHLDAG